MKKIDETKYSTRFSMILKCILSKKRITQGELATAVGLSNATITNYISGRSTPTHKNIVAIADYLGVQPQVFYGDVNTYLNHVQSLSDRFSGVLGGLMADKKITQEELANEIGVSRQTINMYVNGKQLPMSDVLHRLSEYFGVTMQDMLNTTEKTATSMKICVTEMPKVREECIFSSYTSCKFGGECTLSDGKCKHLVITGGKNA